MYLFAMDDEGLKNGGTVLTKDCFLLECKTSFIGLFTERQRRKPSIIVLTVQKKNFLPWRELSTLIWI